MHVPSGNFRHNAQDEFQVELNRVRNSLNALTMKNFMLRDDDEDEKVVMESKGIEDEKIVKFPDFPEELLKYEEDLKLKQSEKALKMLENEQKSEKSADNLEKEDKSTEELYESFENPQKLSQNLLKLPENPQKLPQTPQKLPDNPKNLSIHRFNENKASKLDKSSKTSLTDEKLSKASTTVQKDQKYPIRKLDQNRVQKTDQILKNKVLDDKNGYPQPYERIELSKLSKTSQALQKNPTKSKKIDQKLQTVKTEKLSEDQIDFPKPYEQIELSKFIKPQKPNNFISNDALKINDDIKKLSVPIKPIVDVADFRRSLSKHRQDANRTQSTLVDPNDVLVALTASQEKLDAEKPKIVRFVEKPKTKFEKPSRDSDEIATIIAGEAELPWQKKHQYRQVTPFLKPKTKEAEKIKEISFRPIELSRSIEDLNQEIHKPVPIFASKSYQELPSFGFQRFDFFQTKSSDDLLLDNIDGARKPESKRHRLMRIRSESGANFNNYENFHYEIPQPPVENFMRQKPPQPLPRTSSKTLVYVLDKDRDEFILENQRNFEEVYEDCEWRSSDSILFNSLADSRDDCKFPDHQHYKNTAAGVFVLNVQLRIPFSLHCSMFFIRFVAFCCFLKTNFNLLKTFYSGRLIQRVTAVDSHHSSAGNGTTTKTENQRNRCQKWCHQWNCRRADIFHDPPRLAVVGEKFNRKY